MRYEVTSFTSYHTGPEDEQVLDVCRRLPEDVNPRSRELSARLVQNVSSGPEKARRMLEFFRTGGFVYTLEPPRLGRHSVDDFIFDSRRGYCEHYASAFCFMMRAVHVPARIVGGYQGGEVNPFANYIVVRQADAHVWVEIWDPETGWTRVDPTAVVAPDRISRGAQAALDAGKEPGMFSRGTLGTISAWLKNVRQGWDAISTGWAAFFEGYSYDMQQALLAKLGIGSGTLAASVKALLILVVFSFAIVGLYAWFATRTPRQKADAVKKYYTRFCEKLARSGLARPLDQGPVDYMKTVVKNRPDLETAVSEITGLYVRLRYEDRPSATTLGEFIQKIRAFDPTVLPP
jgi:transglutaminase-like putative cysteine protease